MQKIVLENGITILCVENNSASGFEVSLTFKSGHQNEPKLGLAAVYEKIVEQQAQGEISAVYGGNITSFFTSSGSLKALSKKLNELWLYCAHPTVDSSTVQAAIDDIVQHTVDLAAVPMRQTKLAYKHTAFSQNAVVWDTAEYIAKVSALTVDDVNNYITSNYVGRNIVIGYCGVESGFEKLVKTVDKLFGSLPAGKPTPVKNLLYTGGYQEIPGNGTVQIAMFGWDLNLGDYAETNVLMTMLSDRLERAVAPLAATSEVKIAGYFGFRTLRICVSCNNRRNFAKVIDEVCKQVARLKHENASPRRLETSRQRSMAQRLAISNEALPRAVHATWLFLKRGIDYDNNKCIANIYRTTANDVRDKALDIFTPEMTCVIYGAKASFDDIKAKMQ